MKWFKRITLSLLAIIMITGVISLFLPDTAHVERSTVINASADKVFAEVNDLKAFNRWSPWADIDPGTQYTFSGPDSGVGAKVAWESEHSGVGKGSQEIIESRPNEYVKSRLDFGMKGLTEAQFMLQAEGSGTKITWVFDTFLTNPVERYFGLMMDKWVGGAYDQGLATLKAQLEAE